jgi:K+-transporting ATPase ATPase A chain
LKTDISEQLFGRLSGQDHSPFYNLTLALAMFVGRCFVIVPVLAIAGSLAAKQIVPRSAGTLPTG